MFALRAEAVTQYDLSELRVAVADADELLLALCHRVHLACPELMLVGCSLAFDLLLGSN